VCVCVCMCERVLVRIEVTTVDNQTQIPEGAGGWGAPGQFALHAIVAPLGMTVGGTVAAEREAQDSDDAGMCSADGKGAGSSTAPTVKVEEHRSPADSGRAEQCEGDGGGQGDDPEISRVLNAVEAAGAQGLAEEKLEAEAGNVRGTVEHLQLQGLLYVKDGRLFSL
jgi:hypothetical protein